MGLSVKQRLALLPAPERQAFLATVPEEVLAEMARGEWWYVARPEQIPPPGDWMICLALAGRGYGKSRSSSEWIVDQVVKHPFDRGGNPTEWLVVADTLSDARTINADGPSGIKNVLNRRGIDHRYKQSPRPMFLFPDGAKIYLEGADSADTGRGYNASGAVCDEICIAHGEPVVTDGGSVPVQDVRAGAKVMTRFGWRTVTFAGMTRNAASVVTVTTEDGGQVRLTSGHRVLTHRGWTQAGDLCAGDTVFVCQPQVDTSRPSALKPPPTVSGQATPGTTTSRLATTTTDVDGSCTAMRGWRRMAKFHPTTRSITSTANATTLDLRTLNSSPPPNIDVSPLSSAMTPDGPQGRRSEQPEDLSSSGRFVSPDLSSVTSVGRPFTALGCEPSGALANVVVSRGLASLGKVRSVEHSGVSKVYDLTVEGDAPEFFAGSGAILVHNCKWIRPTETWYEGLMPSLRADLIDDQPRAFITTTPKPIPLLVEWLGRNDGSVHVVTGSTFDNAANLSSSVLRELKLRYDGTALGEQELYGKLLELTGGGLFQRMDIVHYRVDDIDADVISTVVGVDPNLTGDDAETGIVVVSRTADDHLWIRDDATCKGTGRTAALTMWRTMAKWGADLLVYETNLGKRWMQEVLEDAYVELRDEGVFPRHSTPPMKGVDSKHGKKTRAEPVAMRYEQGRAHHVGVFEQLENQMVLFDPESTRESPDRMDALVHACRHLMAGEKRRMRVSDPSAYDLGAGHEAYDLGRMLGMS